MQVLFSALHNFFLRHGGSRPVSDQSAPVISYQLPFAQSIQQNPAFRRPRACYPHTWQFCECCRPFRLFLPLSLSQALPFPLLPCLHSIGRGHSLIDKIFTLFEKSPCISEKYLISYHPKLLKAILIARR